MVQKTSSDSLLQAYGHLKDSLEQKIVAYLQEDKSILRAISRTASDVNISYKNLTHLLFSMFECNSNRQLKKKIKELMPKSEPKYNRMTIETRMYLKRKFLKRIILCFKKGYSARDTARQMGLSRKELNRALRSAQRKGLIPDTNLVTLKRVLFNKRVVYKIIDYLKQGQSDEQILKKFRIHPSHLTKYLKRAKTILNKETRESGAKKKILKVQKLYYELGTLKKVADKMQITRERVRQLLKKGEEYNLFEYKKHSEIRIRDLIGEYSREDLIQAIKDNIWAEKTCKQLRLERKDFEKLLKHYEIDYTEYRRVATMGRYMSQYSKIVDVLGHHPSSTEMNEKSEWRSTWAGISRLWGSLDDFRKEYGIEKPKFRVHPNTLKHWKEVMEKRKIIKAEKKERMLAFINKNGAVSRSTIMAELGFSGGSTDNYIGELLGEGKITKLGQGQYAINKGEEVSAILHSDVHEQGNLK